MSALTALTVLQGGIHRARGLCILQGEQEAVGRLIQYLQAMQGQLLWCFEDSNLNRPHLSSAAALQHFVQSLVGLKPSTRQHSGTSLNSHSLIPFKADR